MKNIISKFNSLNAHFESREIKTCKQQGTKSKKTSKSNIFIGCCSTFVARYESKRMFHFYYVLSTFEQSREILQAHTKICFPTDNIHIHSFIINCAATVKWKNIQNIFTKTQKCLLAKNRKQFIFDSRVQSNLYYSDDNDAIECEIMNFYAADEFIANYCVHLKAIWCGYLNGRMWRENCTTLSCCELVEV